MHDHARQRQNGFFFNPLFKVEAARSYEDIFVLFVILNRKGIGFCFRSYQTKDCSGSNVHGHGLEASGAGNVHVAFHIEIHGRKSAAFAKPRCDESERAVFRSGEAKQIGKILHGNFAFNRLTSAGELKDVNELRHGSIAPQQKSAFAQRTPHQALMCIWLFGSSGTKSSLSASNRSLNAVSIEACDYNPLHHEASPYSCLKLPLPARAPGSTVSAL